MIARSRTNRFVVLEWWRSIDRVTLALFLALLVFGLVLSMAASPAAANRLGYDDPFFFLKRQSLFVLMGIGGAIFVSLLPLSNARRIGVLALFGAIAVMIVLPEIGIKVKGSTRWIRIGPFSLQPSEFAKPGFVVFAAWMFSVRKRSPEFPGVAILFVVYGILIFLLIRQPDFGQSFLLTLCFGAVFFFAGMSIRWMSILVGVSMAGGLAAFKFLPHVRDDAQCVENHQRTRRCLCAY
ncbi:FtsW/RodA/SpoVE family cell cycle protein [bacterium AH-315-J23]|nr:FtsW/RodA/SpoVE family cell cycle protein [bacterium AH-315-J23]